MTNLVDQIREKPVKYLSQAAVAGIFVDQLVETFGSVVNNRLYQYRDQIKSVGSVVGDIGYLALQGTAAIVGGVEIVGVAVLGYISVKGTGMFLENYFKPKD